MGIFSDRRQTKTSTNKISSIVPVWFMRQAGRYSAHYRKIRDQVDGNFFQMCKNPHLAAEITWGPIQEYDFDAAILFSDILFPLEQLGMGLSYNNKSGPGLEKKISTKEQAQKLQTTVESSTFYNFQVEALKIIKQKLAAAPSLSPITLIGFVGAPFTLYTYAVGEESLSSSNLNNESLKAASLNSGSSISNLTSAKIGLVNGCYHAFISKLVPLLLDSMSMQAEAGADAIALFDTAAGELSIFDYKLYLIPTLRDLLTEFKKKYPLIKIIYYSKYTSEKYLEILTDNLGKKIDVIGVDWRHHLPSLLKRWGKDYYIQGNIDPSWPFLPFKELQIKLDNLWQELGLLPSELLAHWICGLGHGVLKDTPEENVRLMVQYIHNNWNY